MMLKDRDMISDTSAKKPVAAKARKRQRASPLAPRLIQRGTGALLTASGDDGDRESASGRLLDDYLSTEQLATELGLTPLTLVRWRALGKGPPVTWIGRRLFYRKEAVQKWLLAQEQRVA